MIDPLIPEHQPSSRYTLTAGQVSVIILTGAVLGFIAGVGLAVTVHFLTV